jgi:hypothetical protein
MRNPFATKARELHDLIAPENECQKYSHDPAKVLEILDRITISEGKTLRCHLVKGYIHDSIGDNSYLYVNDCETPEAEARISFIDDTWKNICVEPGAMGIWQVYLLMTAIHVMPFWWHGGYDRRFFIFSPADLKKIPNYQGFDFSGIDESKLQLEVKFTQWTDRECMGMISSTYWNDWCGLIRETVSIKMFGDKIAAYVPVFNEVLLKFESLVCY